MPRSDAVFTVQCFRVSFESVIQYWSGEGKRERFNLTEEKEPPTRRPRAYTGTLLFIKHAWKTTKATGRVARRMYRRSEREEKKTKNPRLIGRKPWRRRASASEFPPGHTVLFSANATPVCNSASLRLWTISLRYTIRRLLCPVVVDRPLSVRLRYLILRTFVLSQLAIFGHR